MTTPAPRWLLDHLIATGHLSVDGISRRARVRTCRRRLPATVDPARPRCYDQVLVGLDDPRIALEVACDPTPLNQLGEALAAVDGRATYALRREGSRWVLDHRGPFDIAGRPAGTGIRLDVVRQHRCASPAVPDLLAAPTTFPEIRSTPAVAAGDLAPF